jgi:hypothetical protein
MEDDYEGELSKLVYRGNDKKWIKHDKKWINTINHSFIVVSIHCHSLLYFLLLINQSIILLQGATSHQLHTYLSSLNKLFFEVESK